MTYPGQDTPALSDVSLHVSPGEFVFLVGASGSGKSTFLRLILREERVSSGTVTVAGYDVSALSHRQVPHLRRRIGTVFQDFRLLPNKTVEQNVAFALEVIGRPRKQVPPMVEHALELVGLSDKADRFAEELSGGEAQRVAIARAFVNRPSVLIADEPTGNLDPETSQGIMELLERINLTGTTLLMATHDADLVNRSGHRVLEISQGKLVRDELSGSYRAEEARQAAGLPQ